MFIGSFTIYPCFFRTYRATRQRILKILLSRIFSWCNCAISNSRYLELFVWSLQSVFFKLIIVSIDDIDRFEKKKEMKKKRPIKNTWFDWVINYIPELIRKIVGGFKDRIASVFKTNTPKQTVYERGKNLSKPKN